MKTYYEQAKEAIMAIECRYECERLNHYCPMLGVTPAICTCGANDERLSKLEELADQIIIEEENRKGMHT